MSAAVRHSSVLSPSIREGAGKHDRIGDTLLGRWLQLVQVNKKAGKQIQREQYSLSFLFRPFRLQPSPHSLYECLSPRARPFDSRSVEAAAGRER